MRYARIENEQVVEVVEVASIAGRFHSSLVWLECPAKVVADNDGARWGWDGAAFTAPAAISDAPIAAAVRSKRDRLLAGTDWQALSDITMSIDVAAYRQALRDVPAQAGFPNAIDWPSSPQ